MDEIKKYLRKHQKDLEPLKDKDFMSMAYTCFVTYSMKEPTINMLSAFAKYLSSKEITKPTLYDLNEWKESEKKL
jgi:hypothetical protein